MSICTLYYFEDEYLVSQQKESNPHIVALHAESVKHCVSLPNFSVQQLQQYDDDPEHVSV